MPHHKVTQRYGCFPARETAIPLGNFQGWGWSGVEGLEDLAEEVAQAAGVGVRQQGCRFSQVGDHALVNERENVARLAGEPNLVRDDDHRHTAGGEFLHDIEHVADKFGVKRRRRLVEQHQVCLLYTSQQALAAAAQITSIPTLMAFREGVLVFAQPGALPAAEFDKLVVAVKDIDMDDIRRQIAEQQAAEAAASPESPE